MTLTDCFRRPVTTNAKPRVYKQRNAFDHISDKYDNLTQHGKGTFGLVYKATCRKTKKQVAIKYIQSMNNENFFITKALAEIQVLKKMNTLPNNIFTTKLLDIIIPDVGAGEPISWVALVTDYVSYDLQTVLVSAHQTGLGEK